MSVSELLRGCLGIMLVALALTGSAVATPPPRAELQAADVNVWLDGFMPHALAMSDVAGASVAVVRDGKVLALKGYGLADTARGSPVDPVRTRFPVASISKLMTWTAVLQLAAEGRLDLNKDINAYLDFRIDHPGMRAITMADLMTHSAGFQENYKNTELTVPAQLSTLRQYLVANQPPLIFAPGTATAYSNYGASLAGYIVQRVSGEPFAQYTQQRIFAPTAMVRTSFVQTATPDVATGYGLASDGPRPVLYFNSVPAAALKTTAADMALFMNAQLARSMIGSPTIPGVDGRPIAIPRRTQIAGTNGFWAGYAEMSRRGVRVFGHSGDIEGFHSDLYLLPDSRIGLFIAMNSDGRERGAQTVRTQLFRGFLDRYVAAAPAYADAVAKPGTPGMDIAGTYNFSRRIETSLVRITSMLQPVTVTVIGPQMIASNVLLLPSGAPMRFRLVGPDRFREVGGDSGIAIERDARGQIKGWTTDEYPTVFVMQPVTFWADPGKWIPALYAGLAACALGLAFAGARFAARTWQRLRGRQVLSLPAPLLRAAYTAALVAILTFYAALFWWFGNLEGDRHYATSAGDAVLQAIEGLGVLAVAFTPLVLWRCVRPLFAREHGWPGRVALLVVALGYIVLVVIALANNLVNQDLRF